MDENLRPYLGLPVGGYRPQSPRAVDMVNANKRIEEVTLRTLDGLADIPDVDKRWLAIGRTKMEEAWMAINRAIFKPSRVVLPGDPNPVVCKPMSGEEPQP